MKEPPQNLMEPIAQALKYNKKLNPPLVLVLKSSKSCAHKVGSFSIYVCHGSK